MVSTTDIAALGIAVIALAVGAASLGRGGPQTILLELPPKQREADPNERGAGRDTASDERVSLVGTRPGDRGRVDVPPSVSTGRAVEIAEQTGATLLVDDPTRPGTISIENIGGRAPAGSNL